jgi:hypothetical protein
MVAGAVAAFFTIAGAQQGPCSDDVQKLCKDVQPGEGHIIDCLKTHQKEVSPKCSAYVKQVKQELAKVSEACKPDIEKFCSEIPAGKGAIAKCLKQHSADLSPDCKARATGPTHKKSGG